MSNGTYSVYMHTCLADGESFGKVYIGITSRPPEKRWGKRGQYYKHCLHFNNAIEKYGWDCFSHEIVACGLSKQEAISKEIELIAHYDARNPEHGFNLTKGGDVLVGVDNPVSIPVTVFDCNSGKRIADFPAVSEASEFCGADVRNCLIGRSKTVKSYICRYSLDVVGIDYLSQDQCVRHCAHPEKNKPVSQYDLSGIFIKEFASIQDAERELGLSRGVVANAARGASKSGGGFQWRYSSASDVTISPWISGSEIRKQNNSYRGKAVDQLDINTGTVIMTYASAHEAERATGIRRSTIMMVLKGKFGKVSAGGFRWRYHPGGAQ